MSKIQEKEQERESLIDQTLKRYRSSSAADKMAKKRKISRGLFIFNIIILAAVFLFYMTGKKKTDEYQSATFKYKDMQFRFSFSADKDSKNHYFSLSIQSTSRQDTAIYFNRNVAAIVLYHDATVVLKKVFGENINRIVLKPGEARTLVEAIDANMMNRITDMHPEYVIHRKRSIIQTEQNYIPLNAELQLNIKERIAASLSFKYEVK
jgi:hypothetical protein